MAFEASGLKVLQLQLLLLLLLLLQQQLLLLLLVIEQPAQIYIQISIKFNGKFALK